MKGSCVSERDEGMSHSRSEKERELTEKSADELCSQFASETEESLHSVEKQGHVHGQ